MAELTPEPLNWMMAVKTGFIAALIALILQAHSQKVEREKLEKARGVKRG